jgi:heme-degrading monooxygenase HmoA
MHCILTIVRYPKFFAWAGILSMAIFRLPLWMSKRNSFYKLMGSGKNGTFDKTPDWQQWALLEVFLPNSLTEVVALNAANNVTPKFIQAFWKFFKVEKLVILLEPIESHGLWDGKCCFGKLPKQTDYAGQIAVLTRATIRLNKLTAFWSNVASVANQMATAKGFITSFGIGEVPFVKQATFSIWESKQSMKDFAYNMQEHKQVIQKTKKENWYSEEMFTRFKVMDSIGSINGKNLLQ